MSAWREQWLEGWVTVGSVSECMERAMVERVGTSRISECTERAMVGRVGTSRISE